VVCGGCGLVRDAVDLLLKRDYYKLLKPGHRGARSINAHTAISAEAVVLISTNEPAQLANIIDLQELLLVMLESVSGDAAANKRRIVLVSLLHIGETPCSEGPFQLEQRSHGRAWNNQLSWQCDCGLHSLLDKQVRDVRELEIDSCSVKSGVAYGMGEECILKLFRDTWNVLNCRIAASPQISATCFCAVHASEVAGYLDWLLMQPMFHEGRLLRVETSMVSFSDFSSNVARELSRFDSHGASTKKGPTGNCDLQKLPFKNTFDSANFCDSCDLERIDEIKSWVAEGLTHAPLLDPSAELICNPASSPAASGDVFRLDVFPALADDFVRVHCARPLYIWVTHGCGGDASEASTELLSKGSQIHLPPAAALLEWCVDFPDQYPCSVCSPSESTADSLRVDSRCLDITKATSYGFLPVEPTVHGYVLDLCTCSVQLRDRLSAAGNRRLIICNRTIDVLVPSYIILVSSYPPRPHFHSVRRARRDYKHAEIGWTPRATNCDKQSVDEVWKLRAKTLFCLLQDCETDSAHTSTHNFEAIAALPDELLNGSPHALSDSVGPTERVELDGALDGLIACVRAWGSNVFSRYANVRHQAKDNSLRTTRRHLVQASAPCCSSIQLCSSACKMRGFLAVTIPYIAAALLEVSHFPHTVQKMHRLTKSMIARAKRNEKASEAYAYLRFCGSRARF